jgi:hypothetical protein
MHPATQNTNSANFALTELCELRIGGVLRTLSESRNERRDAALAEIFKEMDLFHRYLGSWANNYDPDPNNPTGESSGFPAKDHVRDQYNKFVLVFHGNAIWLGKKTYALIQEFSVASRDFLNELIYMRPREGVWRLPDGTDPKGPVGRPDYPEVQRGPGCAARRGRGFSWPHLVVPVPDRQEDEAVRPETALLIAVSAAVVGQVLGGLLTLFGGWVNDHYAGERMERQQKYEDHKLVEQQKREDQLRLRSEWSRVCKKFVAATTIALPLLDEARQEHYRVLNEAYLETRIYASGASADDADDLYEAAREIL